MKFLTRILPFLAFAPAFVFAATAGTAGTASGPNTGYFDSLITSASGIINSLIPVVLALALLLFLWGMFKYFILGAGDEGSRETGRAYMIYGLIGLAVMVAVWGLVNLLISIVGVDTNTTIKSPTPPVPTTR